MSKLTSLSQLAKKIKRHRTQGKKTGLVTGCFDILHPGHISLFQESKKYAEIIIVGLENDRNIRQAKGNHRPIHSLKERFAVLDELESISYIFEINKEFNFGSPGAEAYHKNIIQQLQPDYIFTDSLKDQYWKRKKARAENYSLTFIDINSLGKRSSSDIIKIIWQLV